MRGTLKSGDFEDYFFDFSWMKGNFTLRYELL